ncbi:RING-type domain-containing protein [Pycnococcus provasolii]
MGWTDLHDSIFREEWDRVRTRLQLELELLDENNLVVGPLAGGSQRDSGGGNSAYDDDDASPSAPVVRSSRSTGGTRETFERDDDMSFPLHLAAQFNAPEDVVVMLLHANPAAAAERDHVGNLPLHCAAMFKAKRHIVELLLEAYPQGVHEREEWNHKSAIEWAEIQGAPDDVKRLLREYADLPEKEATERHEQLLENPVRYLEKREERRQQNNEERLRREALEHIKRERELDDELENTRRRLEEALADRSGDAAEQLARLQEAANVEANCPICFVTLWGSELACVSTRCGHVFHRRCLHRAMDSRAACPKCQEAIKRQDVRRVYL